jgi:cobalt-zinc-cadmium efflux system outer membrane protein
MPRFKTTVAAALAAALFSAPVGAQEEDPVLRALVEEAVARNPQLAAAHHLVTAAGSRAAQAGSLPGPMLGVSYQNDGLAPTLGERDMTMLSVEASQEIPYPGKRSLRRQVAQADAALSSFDAERERLALVASVKRAYHGLRLARALADLAEQQRGAWKEIQETARVRYAAAVGPQLELLRAQVEGTRVQALHAQHHAEAKARLAELNRLLARPPDTPIETSPPTGLQPEPRDAETLVAFSETISPELMAAAAAVQRDELAVELARRDFKPDLVVQGGWSYRGGLDPMWQAGVALALPSRSRARGALAEAEARLAASRAGVDDVRLRLRSAVEQRLALLGAAEQIEATYRDGVLPQEQVSLESALTRYGTGQGPQLAVLEAMVSLLDDRTDYLRLLTAHAIERTRLEEASLEPSGGLEGLLMHGRTGLGGAMGMDPKGMPPSAAGPVPMSSERR